MIFSHPITIAFGNVEAVDLVLTYTVTPERPASLNTPAEPATVEILTVRDTEGNPLSDEQEASTIEGMSKPGHVRELL